MEFACPFGAHRPPSGAAPPEALRSQNPSARVFVGASLTEARLMKSLAVGDGTHHFQPLMKVIPSAWPQVWLTRTCYKNIRCSRAPGWLSRVGV